MLILLESPDCFFSATPQKIEKDGALYNSLQACRLDYQLLHHGVDMKGNRIGCAFTRYLNPKWKISSLWYATDALSMTLHLVLKQSLKSGLVLGYVAPSFTSNPCRILINRSTVLMQISWSLEISGA